jgi:hypothetical protein
VNTVIWEDKPTIKADMVAQAVGEASDEDTDRKGLQDQKRALARISWICMRQDTFKNDGILAKRRDLLDQEQHCSCMGASSGACGGPR